MMNKRLQTFDKITMYPYGTNEHKKGKGTKKCVIERELMFKNYKDSLYNDEIILKSQQRFKNYADCPFNDEIILQQR